MAVLFLMTGPSAGARHDVQGEVIIGRSPSCTIPLEDAKVSRRHVRIVVEGAEARVSDLGSRNGTVVNGERVEGEVVVLPGDKIQVGDTTVLFEPQARAALSDRVVGAEANGQPVEELLPAAGAVGTLYAAGIALLTASSEAQVLRRASEELARATAADTAAALLGGPDGLVASSVVGAEKIEVPRELARGATERKEAARAGGQLCAPILASGGAPFGVLFAERVAPFGLEDQRIAAALGRLVGEALTSARTAAEGKASGALPVGTSRQFKKMVEQARRVAAGDEPVTFVGEFGTGRGVIARYVHGRSSRALGPFILVDCRKPAGALEESLFGRTSSPGVPPSSSVLLRADGGTLFLQEVEALPRTIGERLGRLLARRVAPARQGGEEVVDVRVMATASAALDAIEARGELPPELARVLVGPQVEVLPLRDRRPDVLPLFEFFAAQVSRARRRDVPPLSPDARRLLVDYAWPANIDELKGVAERLALLHGGGEISALQLPPEIQEGPAQGPQTLGQRVARLEREAIAQALREAGGKKIKAAALLGISRPTLDKKIADFQLLVEKKRP